MHMVPVLSVALAQYSWTGDVCHVNCTAEHRSPWTLVTQFISMTQPSLEGHAESKCASGMRSRDPCGKVASLRRNGKQVAALSWDTHTCRRTVQTVLLRVGIRLPAGLLVVEPLSGGVGLCVAPLQRRGNRWQQQQRKRTVVYWYQLLADERLWPARNAAKTSHKHWQQQRKEREIVVCLTLLAEHCLHCSGASSVEWSLTSHSHSSRFLSCTLVVTSHCRQVCGESSL